jgi:hypothetical protein
MDDGGMRVLAVLKLCLDYGVRIRSGDWSRVAPESAGGVYVRSTSE